MSILYGYWLVTSVGSKDDGEEREAPDLNLGLLSRKARAATSLASEAEQVPHKSCAGVGQS